MPKISQKTPIAYLPVETNALQRYIHGPDCRNTIVFIHPYL